MTDRKIKSEKKAFTEIAGLGIDTVETVLPYHVVPGATVTSQQVRAADDAKLDTALGETVKVKIRGAKGKQIRLQDKDRVPRAGRRADGWPTARARTSSGGPGTRGSPPDPFP